MPSNLGSAIRFKARLYPLTGHSRHRVLEQHLFCDQIHREGLPSRLVPVDGCKPSEASSQRGIGGVFAYGHRQTEAEIIFSLYESCGLVCGEKIVMQFESPHVSDSLAYGIVKHILSGNMPGQCTSSRPVPGEILAPVRITGPQEFPFKRSCTLTVSDCRQTVPLAVFKGTDGLQWA